MEKVFYSHENPNDTTYTFERDPDGRGQITMTFTSDDPDYGTEELIYGGYGTEKELRADLMSEMVECMDLQDSGEEITEHLRYYNEFCLNTLPAFAAMLDDMEPEKETETDDGQRTIWMRVGISYTGTKEEIEKILSGDDVPDLKRALKNGTASVDGETYIPAYVVEEYNAEEGTDFPEYDIDWNM